MALKDLERFENQVSGGMRSVPHRDIRDDGVARQPIGPGRMPPIRPPDPPAAGPLGPVTPGKSA